MSICIVENCYIPIHFSCKHGSIFDLKLDVPGETLNNLDPL